MVRITTVDRRGQQQQHDVQGTLVEVVTILNRAHDGLVNFGRRWSKSVIHVADVVAVEPVQPVLPPAPTRAEILASTAEGDGPAAPRYSPSGAGERRAWTARSLSRGLRGAQPTHHLLARPAAEVVWELLTADREVVRLDGPGPFIN